MCGLSVWFVVGVWVGRGVGVGGVWVGGVVVEWCGVCVCIDFELFLRLNDLCGKHSQAESGWSGTSANRLRRCSEVTRMRQCSFGQKGDKLA